MPRRGIVKKKKLQGDQKYNSTLITKFINTYMKQGKRGIAERVIYETMEIVKKKAKEDPLKVFEKAVENVRPQVETKSRRVGGATYQVPVEVSPNRGSALAMRWVVQYARARAGKSMQEKLAAELLDAAAERGEAVRKREETHRMADANKAFAHYRW
jgi:small subunit ribosomal protein S7